MVATRRQGATGIQQVEARDGAKLPTVHSTTRTTKIYPGPDVNSAEVEGPIAVLLPVLLSPKLALERPSSHP